jgi:hypothetical protein
MNYGKPVTVVTDHKPLVETRALKEPTKRFAELMLKLQDHSIKLKYRPGAQHQNADGLSRLCYHIDLVSSVDWAEEQALDTELLEAKRVINDGQSIFSRVRFNLSLY